MGEKEVIKRRGLAKKHAALDFEIWQWKTSLENTRGTQRVTKNEVQAYALEAYKINGISNFKASDGWYRRWRQRWQTSNLATIDNSEEKEQNKTPKGESKLKAAINDPTKKRKASEHEKLNAQEASENADECCTKATKKCCRIEPQLDIFKDSSVSLPHKTLESQLYSEGKEEARQVIGNAIKTTVPVKLNTSVPGLDPLLLNMNFVKVKQSKSKKILRANLTNASQSLKTNAVCGFVTSTTDVLDSKSDTNIKDKIESTVYHRNEIGIKTVENFQKVNFKRPIEQSSAIFIENQFINEDCLQNTFRLIETTEEENLWTVINQEQGDGCSVADSQDCSLADSGISVPSVSSSLETTDSFILSPIFEENGMDFSENEHELFCDSCEDFHPRQKCSHSSCKQKKEAGNSFLLSCVFEKKESIPVANLSHVNMKRDGGLGNNSPETSATQLQNPSVTAPKGKRYLLQFKSRVINYALNQNVKLASEKFKVNRNTVAEWLAERTRSSASVPVKHVNKGAAGDSAFLAWLEDSKFNLTNELVKQKALEWLQTNGDNKSHQSQWLMMYSNRLNGLEDIAIKKRYIAYPEAFKRAVVFHAQTHSNMAAARVFGVARKRIIEWQQQSGDVKKTSKYTNANNVTDEAVDVEVYEWFRLQQPPPTSRQVRNKAVELYRAAGHAGIQCTPQWYYRWRARHSLPPSREQLHAETTPLLIWALAQLDNNKCVSQSALAAQATSLGHKKVSRGWTFRFCKKYSALLQALPSPDTPLPSVLEQQVHEYKQKLQEVISTQGVAEECIIALDEIPLHFLPKDKAKKPLLVRRPGFETCQASLILSCLADGTLLPSIFVFKGSGPALISSSDPRMIAFVNDTGRISDDTMQKWLSDVCFPRLSGGGVVVLDSFDAHVAPQVSQSVTSRNIHIAVIPPGCASRLLPITPFCHTFKSMVEDMCQAWLTSQTAVLESPSPEQLYQWGIRAHKHLARHCKEKIRLAFRNMLLPQSSQEFK